MTYGCSTGDCSGWPPFRLDYGFLAGELKPLESTLHRLWRRVDIPLRDDDAAVPCDSHDRESVHS